LNVGLRAHSGPAMLTSSVRERRKTPSGEVRGRRPQLRCPSLVATPETLRIGILVDAAGLRAWHAEVLDELARVPGLVPCVVGRLTPPARRQRSRHLWQLFERLTADRAHSVTPAPPADWLADVATVDLRPRQRGNWGTLEEPGLSLLRNQRPDILLHLGSTPLGGDILALAPHGVWQFHHGDSRCPNTGPPAFWELVDQRPVTGASLLRLDDLDPRGTVVARALLRTVPHSYRRNLEEAQMGSAGLAAQACRRLLAGEQPVESHQERPRCPVRQAPGNLEMARILVRLGLTWVGRQLSGLTSSDRWHVGVVHRPISSFIEHPGVADAVWLDRPRGADRYVADPFGCPTDDGMTILVEDYDHASRHGRISAYRWAGSGGTGQPVTLREFPTHASYPYLVEVAGEWWCIPETAAAREVRALRFDPEALELEDLGVLMKDVALSDPTLFEWEGRWWLLGTDLDKGANTHLRGWWAEHPLGPWTPHAVDPLLIDVSGSRGAGTPFRADGVLYRPAQDCTRSYGGAVAIKRVVRLDPLGFEEEVASRVEPFHVGEYPDGVHTLSAVGELTLVDGTVHRFSFAAFRVELRARLRRFPIPRRGLS
jgi:hypothetical protein